MATVVVVRLRLLLVAAMAILLAILARSVFDEVRWVLVAAVTADAAVLLVFAALRMAARIPMALAAVFGGLVAAVYGSGGTFSDAIPGVGSGPRRLLSSEWPSPTDPTVIGTLTVLLGLALLIAIELVLVRRLHLTPLVPIAVAAVIIVGLSAPVHTPWWMLASLGLLALVFALVRRDRHERDDWQSRSEGAALWVDRTVIASLLAVAVTTIATSGALALSDRANPRRPQSADDVAVTLDPMEVSSALQAASPEVDLFEVIDRSTLIGRSLPARWRSGALTEYDGQRWVPLVTVRPIGSRLGLPSVGAPSRAPSIRYSLEYLTDDIAVVPLPGRPLEIDRSVLTDTERIVVQLSESPIPGTTVEVVAEIDPGIVEARLSDFALRQIDDVAVGFSERAQTLTADATTQVEQLQMLEAVMREWRLDPQASAGGQQLALVERFVTETQRGTREQFVTAFVLLARGLGLDTRVATGFVIPPDELSIPLTIRSSHAAAWPEVRLADGGWVAFDPVPEVPTDEGDPTPPQPEAQSPAAAQPPIPPPAEEGDDPDLPDANLGGGASRWRTAAVWVARVGVGIGVAVFPFALVIGGILLVKWRRRRRRRMLADPARRIRGEWANTTDFLIDAGLDVSPAWTDERIAEAAAPLARRAPFELRRLASMATAMTFGSTDGADKVVMDALETSRMIDAAIRVEQTRLRRLRAWVSLRSLRPATRSPVIV